MVNYNDTYEEPDSNEFLAHQLESSADKVLGGLLKLSPGVRLAAKPLIDRLTTSVSEYGSQWLGTGITATLKFAGIKDAARIGQTSQRVLQYVIPFWEEVSGTIQETRNYWSSMSALGKSVAQFLPEEERKKGVKGLLGSKNEIIQYERREIVEQAKRNAATMATNLIVRVPQVASTYYGQKAKALAVEHGHVDHLDRIDFKALGEIAEGRQVLDAEKKIKDWGVLGAGLVTAVAQDRGFGDRNNERKPSVLKMISELKTQVEDLLKSNNAREEDPDTSRIVQQIRYQVEEIFRQHQKNMKRGDIPKRLEEQFQNVVEVVSKKIAANELNPGALLYLVGEGKVIRTSAESNKIKTIATPEGVEAEMARLARQMPAGEQVDVEEYFKEAPFDAKELGAIFGKLEGKEKAFVGILFSKAVLLKAGVKEADIKQFHKDVRADIYNLVEKAIFALYNMTDEQRRAAGMTEEDDKLIEKLVEHVQEEGRSAVVKAMKRGPLKDTIGRIMVKAVQDGNHQKLWTEVISAEAKPRDAAEEKLASLDDEEIYDESRKSPRPKKHTKHAGRSDDEKGDHVSRARQAREMNDDDFGPGM